MSREIKFRVWDENNMAAPFDMIAQLTDVIDSYFDKSAIFMQYTGLKDRHGVEIYEGDVLRLNNPEGEMFFNGTAFVEWKEWGFRFNPITYTQPENEMFYDSTMFWHDQEDYEVIGNIYENPELLEAKS